MTNWRRTTRVVAAGSGLALVLLWAGPTSAEPGGGWFGPGQLSVRGAAMSQGDNGSYGLGVWARTAGDPEDARGQFRAGHDGPDGTWGVAGSVDCLRRDASGLVLVSGQVFGSGGQDHAGEDFSATIDVDGDPQRFSDVVLAAPGTVSPCQGGMPGFHDVTRGGYEVTGD
ncbi:MAG TPA: hypothetical protein VI854_08670 [Acidimicrobiia bacterium]|nr:hypothetical protein [Acidimicrobiia bacterium]